MYLSMTKEEVIILSTVALVGFCALLGVDIHLASLPYIMRYMHTDQAHMQQSVSIFLLGMGLSILVYGPLSDKYGRKPVVAIGMLIASMASFSSVWITQITPFLVSRFIQGVGSGVCMGLGRTIVADILQGKRLAIIGSYFALIISLSPLIAPPLGGYLQHWFVWQANFIFLGAFLLLTMLLFVCLCPETNKHKNPNAFKLQSIVGNYWSLLSHPAFMMASIISAIGMTATMVYATVSSIIFQLYFHLTPIVYGWVTMMVGVASILGKVAAPTILKRIGGISALVMGFVFFILGGGWITLMVICDFSTISKVMIGVFVVVFALPLIMPMLMSLALSSFHKNRGVASSIYASLQLIVAFGFTTVLSLYSQKGVIIMGLAYLVLGLSGIILFYIGLKPRMKQLIHPSS